MMVNFEIYRHNTIYIMFKTITLNTKNDIKEKYLKNISISQLAKDFSLAPKTISKILKEFGVYDKNKISEELKQLIVLEHNKKEKFSNKEIGKKFNLRYDKISKILKEFNLVSNKPKGKPPLEISETTAICSNCKKEVLKIDFALVKSYQDGRRLSKCKSCRKKQMNEKLTNSLDSFFKDKEARLKVRAKKSNIDFNIEPGYLMKLYNIQNGICFYTGEELICQSGKGRNPHCLSIDKIIPKLGYVVGNIALCINRFNTVKYNLSLEEIKKWMPPMYEKIENHFKQTNMEKYLI